MSEYNYDVIIIGSGPGGYVAAIKASQLGFKTVCIEKSPTLGGTCLNVGCIPSKALLQSSEYYELLVQLNRHGLTFDKVNLDFSKMMQRKDETVKTLVESIAVLFKRHKVDRLLGTANFIDSHTIEVTNDKEKQTLSAKYFVIATGSAPVPLSFLPFDTHQILSSTDALSLTSIPQSLIVVGAGAIGLELASVYNRLGTKVTVIEMLNRVAPAMDLQISKYLLSILNKQGIEFYVDTKVENAKKNEKQVTLEILQNNQKIELTSEKVLVAIGRRPYTEGLLLKEIGVNVNPKGFVQVNASFKTSISHIYAIGDVIEGPMLAHKASEEGIVAIETLAGIDSHINYVMIPNVIYTHPEAASVGFSEKEAKEAGLELKVGTCFFKSNPRARTADYTEGFVKILGELHSGRIVGVHILGAHASELIQAGVYAMQSGMSLEDIATSSHAHPTLAESIKEAALQALGKAIHLI